MCDRGAGRVAADGGEFDERRRGQNQEPDCFVKLQSHAFDLGLRSSTHLDGANNRRLTGETRRLESAADNADEATWTRKQISSVVRRFVTFGETKKDGLVRL